MLESNCLIKDLIVYGPINNTDTYSNARRNINWMTNALLYRINRSDNILEVNVKLKKKLQL